MFEVNKRLRILAGPNGSGKTTILREVRNNFYSGPFVNADEIEKSFQEKQLINIASQYSITTTPVAFESYMNSYGKSWLKKAAEENSSISIRSIESILLTGDKPTAYDAAVAADFIRRQLIEQNKTFTFETVMSHSSKASFLKETFDKGYKNYLYFICTVSPQINIDRIAQRVRLGGHAVPVEKVRKRYYQSLQVLKLMLPNCYRCYFFDNSSEIPSIEPVAILDSKGSLQIMVSNIPWWLQEFVIDK